MASDALLVLLSSLASAGSELKLQSTGSGLDDLQEEFMDGRYVKRQAGPAIACLRMRILIARYMIFVESSMHSLV